MVRGSRGQKKQKNILEGIRIKKGRRRKRRKRKRKKGRRKRRMRGVIYSSTQLPRSITEKAGRVLTDTKTDTQRGERM